MEAAEAPPAAPCGNVRSEEGEEEPVAATAAVPKKPQRERTADVQADKTFSDLALPTEMVQALAACGFDRPSPVQQAAIPLGRTGSDLIVQAKSGTGKTAVFAVICLLRLKKDVTSPQVRPLA